LVEQPMIAGYEATIASLRAEIERSQDALQQLVDYVKDGCPDDGRYYVMTEAQAALKGIKVAQPASPLRVQETCLECGTCDPCDDDCPNYIEANLPASPLRERDEIARIICCGAGGCRFEGDSEDDSKCYCDTTDFNGSGIEKKTDAILALSDSPLEQPSAREPVGYVDRSGLVALTTGTRGEYFDLMVSRTPYPDKGFEHALYALISSEC
jgi:hypothetical protein